MAERSDRLELCGLEVACVIGDLPEERGREQCLMIDVTLTCDLSVAGTSDQLRDTVDYAALVLSIREALRQAQCYMLEYAAACVARVCLSDPRVTEARVRIVKSNTVPGLREAAVEIVRNRDNMAS